MDRSPRRHAAPSRTVAGWWVLACLWWALAASSTAAFAQGADVDPPSRVARLADLIGHAWLYHPDNGDWTEASRNQILTSGDRLATDPGARAELQVGSTTLRLDSGTELEVAVLDDARISLRLNAGVLAARVRNAAEAGAVDVATDDGRFVLSRAGSYRVDRGARSSFVSVDAGEARYEYGTSALPVGAGQRGEFWIDAAGAAQYALVAPIADAFTAWNSERDRSTERSVAARYVSPEMTGVEDLDRYGTWEQTPDYGSVWFPTAVAADWAPYSTGRWTWVRPWGWTWVDEAPWGFAPFHYGRWVNVRNRWCWTPGVRQPRPVWAPALVGWVGAGPRFGGGRGGPPGPAVGWFPLAPREVYVPAYRSSPRYAREINITNVTNVTTITTVINNPRSARDFQNRRFPQAVTVVPETVFTERRPVGQAAAEFRNAPWARDIAQRGGLLPASPALTAPPVAAPIAQGRPGDPRPQRPAPGFVDEHGGRRDLSGMERGAGRPASALPSPIGASPGDPRSADRGDRGDRNERDRTGAPERFAPGGRGPIVGGVPLPAPQGVPTQAGRPSGPGQGPARGDTEGQVQAPAPGQPQTSPRGTGQANNALPPPPGQSPFPFPGAVRGMPSRPAPETIGRGAAPNAPEPREPTEAPAPAQRPVAPAEASQSPRMRPLPVRRGDERRGDDGGATPGVRPENVLVGRPQQPAVPAPMATPERPLDANRAAGRETPASRAPDRVQPTRPEAPVTAPRPAEPQSPRLQSQRPVEPPAPRIAPQRPPEAQAPRAVEAPRPAQRPGEQGQRPDAGSNR